MEKILTNRERRKVEENRITELHSFRKEMLDQIKYGIESEDDSRIKNVIGTFSNIL